MFHESRASDPIAGTSGALGSFRRDCVAAWFLFAGILNALPVLAAFPSEPGPHDEPAPAGTSAIDIYGRLHRFGETADCKASVFVFLSIDCPVSNGSVPALRRAYSKYRSQNVEFFGVICAPGVSRADARRHRTEYRIPFPVLFDASHQLRRRLEPTHAPQAVVVSPDGKRRYSGAINDRFVQVGRKREAATTDYLDSALSAIIQGVAVRVVRTDPVGCVLEDLPRAQAGHEVTFTRDIAPLVFAHCSGCHHSGAAAPFSLVNFEEVSGHAHQIAAVTGSRFMPPWRARHGFGHFQDQRRLSEPEIEMFRRWDQIGRPRGDRADLPPPPRFRKGWQLGRPDLVLTMPEPFEISAEGPDVHQHFVLPSGLRQDRLVSAIELRPGNRRVVHHASFYIDTSGAARKLDERDDDVGYGGGPGPGFHNASSLQSWLPGMTPRRLPGGTGQPMHARSDLVLEVHYQRTGKPETDRTTVGIYFAPRSARQLVLELQVMSMSLQIPAGEPRHHHHASYRLPAKATLLNVVPHMHLLGRQIKAVAKRPDGSTVQLIRIDDWDFSWQEDYAFVKPIRLPAGTVIEVDAWYDNSTANPLNPHSPPRVVRWGEQTVDEMGICTFRFTCDSMQELGEVNRHHQQYRAEQQADWLRLQTQAASHDQAVSGRQPR